MRRWNGAEREWIERRTRMGAQNGKVKFPEHLVERSKTESENGNG